MKRQISLQILRIFSMLMIVLCHLCNESKIGIFVNLAQLLNVGVFIFLFMSGYLYGRKKKIDVNEFYKKRAVKIMIPFYLFLLYHIYFILKRLFRYFVPRTGSLPGNVGLCAQNCGLDSVQIAQKCARPVDVQGKT